MKKKLVVSAIVFAAVVGVACVALLANLQRIIDSRQDQILALVEERVGREVSVDKISATLWPGVGVRVRNVSLADDADFPRNRS